MAGEWDTKLDVDEDATVAGMRRGQLWEDPHFSANDMSLYLVRHACGCAWVCGCACVCVGGCAWWL